MGCPGRNLLLAVMVLLAVQQAVVQAQDTNNGQGKILWAMGKWLSGSDSAAPLAAMGWTDGGNPCMGWGGVSCNPQGYVTSLNLAGKGLTGSIPSDPGLWAGLTGLTTIDLANNQLTGSVPAAIKSAPLLNNANLADNKALCGYLPTGLPANTGGTGIGVECGAAVATSPALPPAQPSPPPAMPASANTSTAPAPANSTAAAAAPSPPPAAAAPRAAAPQAAISSAPICSCALRGFGSQDCLGALDKECRSANPPEVCASRAAVLNDTAAATALGQYLADACFKGQNMDTSICTCVQNLLGNDCAKARVSLCVKEDPLCLPIQNVVGDSESPAAGDAAQQVATALDGQCSVTEPTQPGVKATMEFPDTSVGQYISKQYTQNVANALSSVTNVPTSSISTLDVRPFTGTARTAAAPKRLLLQAAAGGNGVQATYFLATDDPSGVSQRLSTAANDGTLSARLAQYGISAQAGGLRVQNYLQPPSPAPQSDTSSFPLWALAPIIGGSLLLLGLLALLLWCCCFRKKQRGKKATAYAPPPTKQLSGKKAAAGRSGNDVVVARDLPDKDYDSPNSGSGSGSGYATAGAGAAGLALGGYGAANSYKPAAAVSSTAYKSPPSPKAYAPAAYDLPSATNGRAKFPSLSTGAGVGVGAAAAATAVAAKRAGSSRAPRAESPTSSKSSGANLTSFTAVGGEAPAAPTSANLAHLSTLQSLKARDYQESMARTGSGGNSTLTPWESTSRPGISSLQPKTAPAGARAGAAAAAGVGAGAAAAGAAGLSGTRSGPLGPGGNRDSSDGLGQGSGSGSWKSNVRPASGQLPSQGSVGNSSMMSNPAGKTTQQAERAKFWAQFQETWQQVRQTQNVDNEPGSPSSGTNWTEITERPGRHH